MCSEKSLELAYKLWGWQPHSRGQREWMLCAAKHKLADCGRRWGKSESTAIDVIMYAFERPHTQQLIVAPTAKQTRTIMNEIFKRMAAIPGMQGQYTPSKSPYMTIKFHDARRLKPPTLITSATLGRTGGNLRGEAYDRIIVDEAAFAPAGVIEAVLNPMLADRDGDLVEISTPRGMNLFYQSYLRGQDPLQPDVTSFKFTSYDNPFLSRSFLEKERNTRPDNVFRTEYLAEFLEDGGGVLRNVKSAVRDQVWSPDPRRTYVMGADWARSNDYSVFTVMDAESRDVVHLDRMNQVDYHLQLQRLKATFERWRPVTILAEANSMGQPLIEQMQRLGLPVRGFTTTNATKAQIVEELALSFEQSRITIPNNPVLIGELEAFGMERLPSGQTRYSAPEGLHDDCVISLCLAHHACNTRPQIMQGLY